MEMEAPEQQESTQAIIDSGKWISILLTVIFIFISLLLVNLVIGITDYQKTLAFTYILNPLLVLSVPALTIFLSLVFAIVCGVSLLLMRKKFVQGFVFVFLFGIQGMSIFYFVHGIIGAGIYQVGIPAPNLPAANTDGNKGSYSIDRAVNSLMNSDGFTDGKKIVGSGDATYSYEKTLLKKANFISKHFGTSIQYAVIREIERNSTTQSSSALIVEPKQTNKSEILEYDFNKVENFNPWLAGSDITGGVDQIDYNLVADHELVVTFKVEKDVSFPGNESECIKRGEYTATYSLNMSKSTYSPTSRMDQLIKSTCLDRGQG
jgi:hypothetical protein